MCSVVNGISEDAASVPLSDLAGLHDYSGTLFHGQETE